MSEERESGLRNSLEFSNRFEDLFWNFQILRFRYIPGGFGALPQCAGDGTKRLSVETGPQT